MKRSIATAAALIGIVTMASALAAAPPERKTLDIGQAAPDFKLPGIDGKTYSLADFKDAKLLCIVFHCNHCPTAQAYDDRLIQLDRDYKNRGVAVVAVSPNDPSAVRLDEQGYTEYNDSLDEMKQRAKDKGFEFVYLYDGETQAMSNAYGVIATPHVMIFDQDRKLRYNGRIDDSDIAEVKSHDARNALDALLVGKPVPVETTRVFGCSTKWAEKAQTSVDALKKADAEPVTIELIDREGVEKLAKNDSDKYRLINLWATWCGPCVQEMPELVTMNRMYRKRQFEFITISLDQPDQQNAALELLKQTHASAKNYLFNSTDRDKLAEALDPQWPGPLPYTLLIAPGGKVVYRHSGPIDPLEMKKAIVDNIGRTYASRYTPGVIRVELPPANFKEQ
jgi:peroxiredoxin